MAASLRSLPGRAALNGPKREMFNALIECSALEAPRILPDELAERRGWDAGS